MFYSTSNSMLVSLECYVSSFRKSEQTDFKQIKLKCNGTYTVADIKSHLNVDTVCVYKDDSVENDNYSYTTVFSLANNDEVKIDKEGNLAIQYHQFIQESQYRGESHDICELRYKVDPTPKQQKLRLRCFTIAK